MVFQCNSRVHVACLSLPIASVPPLCTPHSIQIISMVAKLAGGGERDRAGIEEQRSDDLDSLISIRTSAKPGSPLGPSTPLSQQTSAQHAQFERASSRLRRESLRS